MAKIGIEKQFIFKYSEEFCNSDENTIINLLNSFYLKSFHIKHESLRKAFNVFVKDNKNSVIGGIYGYSELSWLYLDSMYIQEEYRNLGIGSKLLLIAEETAKKRYCKGIKFESFRINLRFYQNKGYEVYYIEDEKEETTIYYLKKNIKYE